MVDGSFLSTDLHLGIQMWTRKLCCRNMNGEREDSHLRDRWFYLINLDSNLNWLLDLTPGT